MAISHHAISHQTRAGARSRHRQYERGYILVMFSLLLIPMLLTAGFSIDVGSWYDRASSMRKAADAAALAGVVWLPDEGRATTEALDVAARNGFVPSATLSITVKVSTKSTRRLQVTITDTAVSSFIYENVGGKKITLTRTGFAEYVLPVPMGSPRNFIGTGLLLAPAGSGIPNEELYMSVNPFCTDRVNGDQFQSSHQGGLCSGTPNPTPRPEGYTTYIEVPKVRPGAIEVRLLDARYNDDCLSGIYNGSTWRRMDGTGTSSDYTTYAPGDPAATKSGPGVRYSPGGTGWTELKSATQTATAPFWQKATNQTCVDPDPAIDTVRRKPAQEDYTYTMFAADNTPLNDSDNPIMPSCSRTFTNTTPFDGYTYMGSKRWNTLCTIPVGATPGRYLLKVRNGQGANPVGDGSNEYGIVAKYTNAAGLGLCDGRTDATCPRVYGKDALSVKAASSANVAQFYLAEIEPQHAGKKLKISLFDPGEGGRFLRILRPTGANTWTPVTFKWESPGVTGSPGVTSNLPVRVSGTDVFNGRLVEIEVDLAGYAPPANNNWWKIEYEFAGSAVTDRTTWQAEILGDPVHLVEEY